MKTKIFVITIFFAISALSVSFFVTHDVALSDSQVIIVSGEEESSSESDYVNPIQEQEEEYNNNENENTDTRDYYKWRDEEALPEQEEQGLPEEEEQGLPEEEEVYNRDPNA